MLGVGDEQRAAVTLVFSVLWAALLAAGLALALLRGREQPARGAALALCGVLAAQWLNMLLQCAFWSLASKHGASAWLTALSVGRTGVDVGAEALELVYLMIVASGWRSMRARHGRRAPRAPSA